ncbi:MAG: O-antigen ligase family protein [Ardenticatenia bacterium]|nr:O-antigen ligase family protein [Ardenticatenia bacterium]
MVAGGALTNVELLMVLLLFVWGGRAVRCRRLPRWPPELGRAVLLWVAVMAVAALLAPDNRLNALRFTLKVTLGALIGWAVYDVTFPSARRRERLGQMVALGGLVVALAGLAEAGQVQPVASWLAFFKVAPTWVGEFRRVSATLPYATITGMVLEMVALLWLAWTLSTSSRKRGAVALGLVVTLVALVLTLSRGAMLSLTLMLLAWGVTVTARRRTWVPAVLLAGGALITVAATTLLVAPELVWRLRTETDRAWYLAEYQVPPLLWAKSGRLLEVEVTVRNAGVRPWGPKMPALGYHLRRADGEGVTYDGLRTPLEQPVPPGGTVRLQAVLQAPPEPGSYVVEWDMVYEGLLWFSWKGSPTATTQLIVEGLPRPVEGWNPTPFPVPDHVGVPIPERPELWRAAWLMARERPLLGFGPDTFRLRYGAYLGYERWNQGIHANNLYLELLATTGWLGLVAFGVVVWRLVVMGLAVLWRTTLPWAHGTALAVGAWLVHSTVDAFLGFTPTLVLFWCTVGLLAAHYHALLDGESRGTREAEEDHAAGI